MKIDLPFIHRQPLFSCRYAVHRVRFPELPPVVLVSSPLLPTQLEQFELSPPSLQIWGFFVIKHIQDGFLYAADHSYVEPLEGDVHRPALPTWAMDGGRAWRTLQQLPCPPIELRRSDRGHWSFPEEPLADRWVRVAESFDPRRATGKLQLRLGAHRFAIEVSSVEQSPLLSWLLIPAQSDLPSSAPYLLTSLLCYLTRVVIQLGTTLWTGVRLTALLLPHSVGQLQAWHAVYDHSVPIGVRNVALPPFAPTLRFLQNREEQLVSFRSVQTLQTLYLEEEHHDGRSKPFPFDETFPETQHGDVADS